MQTKTLSIAYSSALTKLFAVATFTLLTVVSAKIRFPLPFTPVPVTFQVFAVLLSGVVIGPWLGGLSQLLYVGLGCLGLPVWAGGGGTSAILGPTGGYILAFPIASFTVALLVRKSRTAIQKSFALAAGLLVIYLLGALWLANYLRLDLSSTLKLGVFPFILIDTVKLLLILPFALRVKE